MPQEGNTSHTIDRCCDILNVFSLEQQVLSQTEIATKVGLPKSTTSRLLDTLERRGMVSREREGRKGYRLGYQLIRWGTLAQASNELRNSALPVMRSLSAVTGESVVLSVREGNAGIWIELVESGQPIRITLRVGQRIALHAGASSKVLWAFSPPSEVERLLAEIELPGYLPNTITNRDAMRAELQTIRLQGFATSFEETDPGAMGIAVPVYDHTGGAIAGIGIVAPLNRIPRSRVDEIVPVVVQHGHELSRKLGANTYHYQPSPAALAWGQRF